MTVHSTRRRRAASAPSAVKPASAAAELPPALKQSAISEFASRLRFSSQEGRIWLDERRMVMLHAEAFGALREELIASLGSELARGLLTRIGYAAGCRDAEFAWKLAGSGATLEALLKNGSAMHAMQGFGMAEGVPSSLSLENFNAEWTWQHSLEDEAHIQAHGIGNHPVCWFEIGYSSGLLTMCTGRPILAREIECRAMGAPQCRVVAKPVADWEDAEDDLRFLSAQPMAQVRKHAKSADAEGRGRSPSAASNASAATIDEDFVVGASAASHALRHRLLRVAVTNATVLLLGESGVGKSMVAREVHRRSRRVQGPFVEVNCAAIPEQLIESELFGVERGAFSGAAASRAGRFEAAEGGTLFLDEIGTLSMTAQSKLLRVLQSGEFERLGSTKTRKTDVRVIAATNEDLRLAVQEGRFREDLYFRINVFPLQIAPLRERRDDIPHFTDFLLSRFAKRHGRVLQGITSRAMHAILHHSWPGNIRELENVLERGVILAEDNELIDIHHLFSVDRSFSSSQLFGLANSGSLIPLAPSAAAEPDSIGELAETLVKEGFSGLDAVEEALIRAALKQTHGNVSKAAGVLRITRNQLDYRVKKLNLVEVD